MWRGDRAYEGTALVLHGYVYARTIRICCKAATASDGITESRIICTDHLAWVKAGSSPGGCVCGAAIEAPPANPVIQLCGRVVRVYGVEMLLSRVVISDLMCSTRYLRWDYMCGRGICCSAGSSFVGRIAGFSPWLDTIRGLGEASRLLVICTWTLRISTWIAGIDSIRGSDIYIFIEPNLVWLELVKTQKSGLAKRRKVTETGAEWQLVVAEMVARV
jgi:hypothetical protein